MKIIGSLENWFGKANKIKDEYGYRILRQFWPKAITPNHLTLVRIVIGVFVALLLFWFNNNSIELILPLFFIGVLTDLLDGIIARGFGMETQFGKIADPVADRIIILPVAVYSLIGEHAGLLFFILALEMYNACLALTAQIRRIDLGNNIFGKVKMFLQSVVLLGILLFWPQVPHIMFIYVLWVSVALMLLSIFLRSLVIFRHDRKF